MKYVDALLRTEKPENEDRATDLLGTAFEKTKQSASGWRPEK